MKLTELIKETYARMPDEKLIEFVKMDGINITYDAFILLKREYSKRNLDPNIIAETELLRQDQLKLKIQNNLKREEIIVNERIWREVFRQKSEGKKNEEIILWLTRNGTDPETATNAMANLSTIVRAAYRRSSKAMLISFAFILSGIVIFATCISHSSVIQYAWLGILPIITILKFLPANHKLFKLCQKTLIVIEEEETL